MFPSSRARLPEAVADIVAAIRASQAKIAALQGEDAPVEAELPTSPRPLPPKRRSRRPLKRLPRLPFRSKAHRTKKERSCTAAAFLFYVFLREEALEDGILRLPRRSGQGLELEELVAGDLADGGLVE